MKNNGISNLGLLVNEGLFIGVTTEQTLINQNSAYSQIQKAVVISEFLSFNIFLLK
jgi:hypothetical protein